MRPRLRGWQRAAAWLAILTALVFGSCLVGERTIVLRDLYTQFQGPRWWYGQCVRAGEIPFWNPFVGCGVPFVANPQNAVFYPPSLIFAALPFGTAFAWYAAAHTAMLGFFCYLLARGLGLSFGGALLAGTIAGFAGLPAKQIEFPEMLGGLAWTPLVLLGGWKCLTEAAPRWAAVLGAAFGLQLLAGSPYPPLYALLGLLCAAGTALAGRRAAGARAFLWLGSGLGLGALLGCAQYVPTLCLARDLPAEEFGGLMQARFSLRLRDLADLAGPWLAGFPNWQKCFYVGIGALFFAALGLRRPPAGSGRRPAWGFALALAAAGVVLALGRHLGTDQLIAALPLVRRAGKWPTMALSLTVLGLALLAGAGLERWQEARRPERPAGWARWLGILAALALALGLDAALGTPLLGRLRAALLEPMLVFRSPSLAAPRPLAAEAARLAAGAGAGAALVWAGLRSRRRGWLPLAACLLCGAELLSAGRNLNYRAPADLYAEPPPADVAPLAGPAAGRVYVPKSFSGFGDIVYGSAIPEDFRTLRALFDLDTVMSWRIFTTQGSGSVQLPDYQFRLQPVLDALAANGSPEALRLLGAWNVPLLIRGGLDATGLHVGFARNPYALPRARLVEAVATVPRPADALAAIAAGRWDPATLLVSWDQRVGERSAGSGAPGAVTALDYGPGGIRVGCAADRPCFLVLAENWAEGWSVRVDGAPAPLIRANFLQQAVALPAGRHQVLFRYAAPGAGWGLGLALLGLAGLGGCAAARKP
ncbi:MAG TPA: hypothetical protein VHC86_11250 [Opitutaceae bacterium]|nr:hypothetical protein [Opitutaceae bacterium]